MRYLFIVVLLLSGCKSTDPITLIPVVPESRVASFDGNDQSSGIIGFIPGRGFELTNSAASRYKKLSETFMVEATGLSIDGGKNILTKEGMVIFLDLNGRNINR